MTPGGTWSAERLTLSAAGGALGVLLLVVLVPVVRFAYRAPALHIALETAEALIALVVGYLALERFRQSGRTQDLLLASGLAVLALANLVLTALPAAVALSNGNDVTRWAPLLVRLFGTVLLVLAALVRADAVLRDGEVRRRLVVGGLAVAGLVVLGYLLGDRLPPAVDPGVDLDGSRLVVAGHPLVLATQVLTGLLYAVASVAFTRKAAPGTDELVRWLGAACAVAAVARVGYLLFPSLYSQYVCIGDLLRLAFYGLLLVGAAREVRSYWANTAVQEDRRRMARDLHDGLTQELAYVFAQSKLLQRDPGDRVAAERIGGAAARALDEARSAISALSAGPSAGFYDVLHATCDGLASRYDVKVVLQADEDVQVSPAQADAVLRIVAEAFRNAVLHGGADRVDVLVGGAPLRVEVRDDGAGFDTATRSGTGFGLISMSERAQGTRASFRVESQPGGGTVVQVAWA